ncbi:MAG TPA: hypothetical protein PKK69_09085, partial [Ferruginibacter sp.]|nr:hypothetical protein [Ferruginibacter sp.]
MRRCCCLILGIFIQSATWAQSLDSLLSEINDLSTVEQPAEESFDPLEDIARNPWNIQTVQRDDLVRIPWLSPQQVQAFFLYRERFSGFQTLYELQAIPGWDILTIRKTLPLLRWESLTNHHWIKDERNRQEILIRWTQSFTNYREGTTSSSSAKLGPSFRNLIRYKLRYNQHVDAGILAEKDPGEPFFRQNKWGYDFYSAHLFFHGNRFIKKWILGDYIVNMGQGLIQWQGVSLSPS